MNVVTSGDCTAIVFDRIWDGPPLISSGGPTEPFGASAADRAAGERFTVLNHDRRGGGRSGDTRRPVEFEVKPSMPSYARRVDQGGSMAFQEPKVRRAGHRIYVRDYPGERNRILLMHGFSDNLLSTPTDPGGGEVDV